MQPTTMTKDKYFDFGFDNYGGLRYPLYSGSPCGKELDAAYIVFDMAWTNPYFVAGVCDDSTTLQETDWNNRIMQFNISSMITRDDLEDLARDACFYNLVRRLYAGCKTGHRFRTCHYNEDARNAFAAISEHLEKIPVAELPEDTWEFQQALIKDWRDYPSTEYEPDFDFSLRTGFCMSIIPENSHKLFEKKLLSPHRGLNIWPD